jgi:hypothetical protein
MRILPPARALLVLAAAQWCACAQSSLEVAIFDYAGAPHSVIASAVEIARRGFLTARIPSHWTLCEPRSCAPESPGGLYLEIFVMPRLRLPLVPHMDVRPAGYAMREGFAHPRGYALYDAARSVADRTTRPVDVVLGCILLHEAGHLLGLGHRPQGVMRANLEAADMDNTAMGRAFTLADGIALRAAVDQNFQ